MSSIVEFTHTSSQLQRVKGKQSGSAMALGSHSPALRDGGTIKVMGEGLLAKSTPQFLSLTIINFQHVIGPVDVTLRKTLSKAFSEATPYWEAMHLRIREVQTHLAIRFCPSSSSLCTALCLWAQFRGNGGCSSLGKGEVKCPTSTQCLFLDSQSTCL